VPRWGSVERKDFIDRHEVNNLAESLQLRSEYIHRYRRHDLAAWWGRRSHAMIDEHKTVPTDASERAYCPAHGG